MRHYLISTTDIITDKISSLDVYRSILTMFSITITIFLIMVFFNDISFRKSNNYPYTNDFF